MQSKWIDAAELTTLDRRSLFKACQVSGCQVLDVSDNGDGKPDRLIKGLRTNGKFYTAWWFWGQSPAKIRWTRIR